jgi:hypothetical protein
VSPPRRFGFPIAMRRGGDTAPYLSLRVIAELDSLCLRTLSSLFSPLAPVKSTIRFGLKTSPLCIKNAILGLFGLELFEIRHYESFSFVPT